MKRKQTSPRSQSGKQANTKPKLDKRAIRQTLKGYARADHFFRLERRTWLSHLTIEQARAIFDDLHQDADTWERFGGDLKSLEQRRIASKIQGRRILMQLFQRSKK